MNRLSAAAIFLLAHATFAALAATPRQGQLDSSFAPRPGTDDTINVVFAQPDGKVVVAGRFGSVNGISRNRIARLNFDGSLDGSFDPGFGPDGDILAAILQPDGRIVLAGRFTSFSGFPRNRICRLNADGSVDPSFGNSPGINNTPLALALQNDGRILVGGQFSQVDLALRFNIARLNADGTLDQSFDPGNGPNGDVTAISVLPDGRIVIGGLFNGYDGFVRGGVARLFADGSLDPTFDSGVGTGGNVFAVAVERSGTILIGGRFVQYGGTNRTYLARLFSDGSLDGTFAPIADNWVQALALQSDGRILIGGLFTAVDGLPRNRVARLNSNGSIDLTFDPGAGFVGSLTNDATQVRSLALQRFDRVLAAGSFTSYDDGLRANVARLFAGSGALRNISARAQVLSGDNVLIVGFVLEGTQSKTVLLRGIGPSLAAFGVTTPLADPLLELHDSMGAILATNDNWKDTQQSAIQQTGFAPPNDLDSAILVTLAPGSYTAVLRGTGMTTGVGLLDLYDVDQNVNTELTNLSARGVVGTGETALIGGTMVSGGSGSGATVLVRALGPSLASFGVNSPLHDPTLSFRDGNGNLIATNDNWKDSQQAQVAATGLAPPDDRESALLLLLQPGSYTATVAGKSGSTGVALLEFYNLL